METLREKRARIGRIGGKKGKGKQKRTLEKEASLEAIRQKVYKMSGKLVESQAVVAMGTYQMIEPYIDEAGIPHTRRIRDMKRMDQLIETGVHGKDYLIVTGQDPDPKAADSLMNRAYGRPTETVELSGKDGEPLIIKLDE